MRPIHTTTNNSALVQLYVLRQAWAVKFEVAIPKNVIKFIDYKITYIFVT